LKTGKNPHEVRVSPDHRHAYVAAGKSITAVDLQKRQVKANFDLGTYSAHDIRVSRDGRLIWAACAGAQSIVELDSDTGKILKTYPTEQQGSWFVEITPDERKFYTPNLEGKSVSVIDRATSKVKVIKFEHAVYGIDITPDERKFYTPNLEGKSVSVIDRATSKVKVIKFEHAVYGIDITPDGKQVWVSGGDLAVIDTTSDEVVARIKTSEAETGRIKITSDGKRLVVALSKKLAVFDVATHRLISETELSATPKVLTVSADNRRALLTNPEDNSVSVVDIVSGKQVTTFKTGTRPDGIGWANL